MNELIQAVAADLVSAEPAPDLRAGLAAFEPLIGSWDMRTAYQKASGERIELGGYVNFGWGLRGTAIVDIFAFETGVVGTTIRYYDAENDRIRSTWICPARNALIPFLGRAVDGTIVFNAALNDPPGRRLRWSFVKIEPQAFYWTGEVCDDGSAWRLVQEIEAKRR
jgi:hypothetical protein